MTYLIQKPDSNLICTEEEAKEVLRKTSVTEFVAIYRLTQVGKVEKVLPVRQFKNCVNEGGYVEDMFNNVLFTF